MENVHFIPVRKLQGEDIAAVAHRRMWINLAGTLKDAMGREEVRGPQRVQDMCVMDTGTKRMPVSANVLTANYPVSV